MAQISSCSGAGGSGGFVTTYQAQCAGNVAHFEPPKRVLVSITLTPPVFLSSSSPLHLSSSSPLLSSCSQGPSRLHTRVHWCVSPAHASLRRSHLLLIWRLHNHGRTVRVHPLLLLRWHLRRPHRHARCGGVSPAVPLPPSAGRHLPCVRRHRTAPIFAGSPRTVLPGVCVYV